jgi:signal transduction histidine kinase/ActR/RegA family two-component response regulator
MAERETMDPASGDAAPVIGLGSNPYQLTLTGVVLPVRVHCAFNALAAVCALLLGHPAIAACGFAAACLGDTVFQRMIRHWLTSADKADEAWGLRRLAAACAIRVSIYLAPSVVMALIGGRTELTYLTVVAISVISLAPAVGSLSRVIFWSLALPVVVACASVAATLDARAGAALLIALGALATLLAMISRGSSATIGAWQAAYSTNLAMIPQLEAARDQAMAEHAAADAAREEARRANRAKSTFLATMSHEIRTPMNGVLGMAQLLRRDETHPVQAERIATLLESGEYLLSILDDILDVSKIDAGRLEIVRGVEDLRLFLDRLVGFWGGRASEKGVALGLHVDDRVPDFVLMDALRLRQVLFNLVGNALKFTEQGSVEVLAQARSRETGGVWVRLSVRDTGPGIAAQHLPSLFERFSQGDEFAVRKFGGTGLGLAIAKQLTELMGGRIWVESELGAGATFHIEIPLDLAMAGAPIPASASSPSIVVQPPSLPPLRVLAVDDNKVNLLVLDQLLSAFGHVVAKAGSGAEALEVLAAQPFDLVLMDIQMPDMSGTEALGRLRAGGGPNAAAPVIALTADVTSGGRQRYLDLGFTEHSTKPIKVHDLVDAIARAMVAERPEAQAARSA